MDNVNNEIRSNSAIRIIGTVFLLAPLVVLAFVAGMLIQQNNQPTNTVVVEPQNTQPNSDDTFLSDSKDSDKNDIPLSEEDPTYGSDWMKVQFKYVGDVIVWELDLPKTYEQTSSNNALTSGNVSVSADYDSRTYGIALGGTIIPEPDFDASTLVTVEDYITYEKKFLNSEQLMKLRTETFTTADNNKYTIIYNWPVLTFANGQRREYSDKLETHLIVEVTYDIPAELEEEITQDTVVNDDMNQKSRYLIAISQSELADSEQMNFSKRLAKGINLDK